MAEGVVAQAAPPAPAAGDPRQGSVLHRAARGFAYPLRGLAYMFRHPALWTFALVPVAISLVLLTGIFVSLVAWNGDLTALVWSRPEAWYWQILWWGLYGVLFVGVFVVASVSLPGLVASPFNDALSERTENLLSGPGPEAKAGIGAALRGLGRTLLDEVLKIALLLFGHGLILILLLIPVAGQVLYPVVAGAWTCLWLAAEYLEYPIGRNGMPFEVVRKTVRGNFALSLGFGGAVSLVLMVPFLNFFFVPVAVVGGTLLYADLVGAGVLRPPARR